MNLSVYTRPKKPLLCKEFDFSIKNPMLENNVELSKTKLIAVDSSTECHTTPDQVADYMAECLDYETGLTLCEPHAGTGQLIAALVRENIDIDLIKAYELNFSLCDFVKNRFSDLSIEQGDFLEVNESFDRIICNPPFKKIIKHVDHVYQCLNKGGIAICLVPVTYKKINHEIIDILDENTFLNCKVRTKIIKIVK
jgi:phospholipid N-methyltransferase